MAFDARVAGRQGDAGKAIDGTDHRYFRRSAESPIAHQEHIVALRIMVVLLRLGSIPGNVAGHDGDAFLTVLHHVPDVLVIALKTPNGLLMADEIIAAPGIA